MKELEADSQVFDYEVIVPTNPESRYQCSCPTIFENDVLRAKNDGLERRLGQSLKVLRVLAWASFYISVGAVLIGHYEVAALSFMVALVSAFGEWWMLR